MQLNYKTFGEGFPVIILHGLLGSLDNWQTIAKKMAEHYQVFIIDQRNHGKSPHSSEFDYQILANDLLEFMKEHQLAKVHLIGHSMGGKAAMKFALKYREKVGKLAVVDVAPVEYDDRHSLVFDAIFAANVQHASSRDEVEKTLRDKLGNDEATVQFLLKGLQRAESGHEGFNWKFNAEALWKNYRNIADGIYSLSPFVGEVLFIKGANSNYITNQNYAAIQELFPNNQLSEIKDAGHWVHAEKSAEFVEEVTKFLR